MNSNKDREYWDLESKNQGKERMLLINNALKELGGIIHDIYEEKYYKQQWRNPILMRISLPKGTKYKFILAAKLKCWLYEPPKVNVGLDWNKPILQLKGNHDELIFKRCRHYIIHPEHRAYIKDYNRDVILKGSDNVKRILDGQLDLIYSFNK